MMATSSYDDFESDDDDDIYQDDYVPSVVSSGCEKPSTSKDEGVLENNFDGNLLDEIGISSDQKLTDADRQAIFHRIQETWHIYANRDGVVQQIIHELLNSSGDPYLSALYAMHNTYDFEKSKTNSLAVYVMSQFESWLDEYRRLNGSLPYLSNQTTLEAICAVAKQKNGKLIGKVVSLYQGIQRKEFFVKVIRSYCIKCLFVPACKLAIALQLFSSFEIHDFVLPLIIQDKTPLAEDFIAHSIELQKATICFLDDHLEYPRDILPIISKSSYIPEIKYDKLNPKSMGSLISRLAKRYKVDTSYYPHANLKQQSAGLRYLIHKKYSDNAIVQENWEELVHVSVAESVELQVELINLLVKYADEEAAVNWAIRYSVPFDRLPSFMPDLITDKKDKNLPQTPFSSAESDPSESSAVEYHILKLSDDKIRWISSFKEMQESLKAISQSKVVGFDVEWQPTFGAQIVRAAILQVATDDEIFIFDIFSLREIEKLQTHQGELLVQQLFANPDVLKLGFSMKEDLNVLSRSLPGLENISKLMCKWVDLHSLWNNIQSRCPSFFPKPAVSKDDPAKGLSGLAKLSLGLPLNKKEQFSDWERRPLRKSQLIYAALDAHCLVEIFHVLQKRSESINVDWWQLLEKSSPNLISKPSRGTRGRGRGIARLVAPESSDCHVPPHSSLEPIGPSDIRFVCDTMVHRLGKLLRSCGIDTVLSNDSDSHDECVHVAMQQKRQILSRGSVARKLSQHVAVGQCLSISSDKPDEQIRQVIQHFNIRVEEKDIFTRCQGCNSNSFHRIHRDLLQALRSGQPLIDPETPVEIVSDTRSWVLVDLQLNVLVEGLTCTGSKIQFDHVPQGVLECQEYFYVCIQCGKCFWNGSHLKKVMQGSLKYALCTSETVS